MSEHLDVVSGDRRAPSPSVGSTPITTHYAPRRRHCSESKRRYPARILLCVEAFAAALIWVGVSRIFFHISSGVLFRVPLIPLHSIKPRRGAPPDV